LGLQIDIGREEAIFNAVASMDVPGTTPNVICFEKFSAAYEAAVHRRRGQQLPELIEAFQAFDLNGDGEIEIDEMYSILELCSPVAVSRESCESIFKEIQGKSDSESISYEQFASRIIDSSAHRDFVQAHALRQIPDKQSDKSDKTLVKRPSTQQSPKADLVTSGGAAVFAGVSRQRIGRSAARRAGVLARPVSKILIRAALLASASIGLGRSRATGAPSMHPPKLITIQSEDLIQRRRPLHNLMPTMSVSKR